jgi:rare lipoprotein A
MLTKKVSIARVSDRGPFIKGRILDVSLQVAKDLGIIHSGTGKVCYEIM